MLIAPTQEQTERTVYLRLSVILAAAFITRIVLIVVFKTYTDPVAWEFERVARNLLAGEGHKYIAYGQTHWSYGTPLFAFLCAGIYRVTNHSYLAVLIVQSLASVALALTVFSIGRMVFNTRVGLLAAALVAFHPGFVYYDVFNLLPLSIDSLLIAATVLLLLKCRTHPNLKAMLILGAVIGIGVLSRGIIGVLLPFAVICLAVFGRRLGWKSRLKFAACIAAGVFITLSPWLIRNYVIHKQVVISTTSGELFWRGNNRYATGTLYDQNKTPIINLWPKDFKAHVSSLPELEQKRFFEQEAWGFLRNSPAEGAKLYLKKIYYFWWFSPQSGITYPGSYLAAYKYLYTVLLIFFIAGIGLAIVSAGTEKLDAVLILVLVPLTICLGQSIFYVEGRHRWLIEPLMIIFSSYGLMKCWALLQQRLRGT